MTLRPWARRIAVGSASAAALVAFAVPAEAAGPTTASTSATTAVTAAADVDYATWQRDCQAVMDQALPYLKQRIADARPGERQAIVFDIDNTTLETDFGFSFPQPANRPALRVAQYAQDHGVALFFVTARPGIIAGVTDFNLEHVGYDVSGLYVRGFLDLFNLTNSNAAESRTITTGASFLRPTAVLAPMTARIGARLSF